MITILYFARLREITGKAEESLPVESITVRELLAWADETYAGFIRGSGSMFVAVNEQYAQPDDRIRAGDVVAFIPPVSGG